MLRYASRALGTFSSRIHVHSQLVQRNITTKLVIYNIIFLFSGPVRGTKLTIDSILRRRLCFVLALSSKQLGKRQVVTNQDATAGTRNISFFTA
jgi:hypothetical protein